MNSNLTLNFINGLTIDSLMMSLLKLFLIVGGLLYIVFAFVAVRQVSIMKKTLITEISPFITTIGLTHLIAAISVVAYFILIL